MVLHAKFDSAMLQNLTYKQKNGIFEKLLMKNILLKIQSLRVENAGKEILHGVDFDILEGEIHVLMGPNGSGKSTLASVLMGHQDYKVTKGSVTFMKKNILKLSPDKRSHLGLFLAFQYPHTIPGVTVRTFLKQALNAKRRAKNPEDKGVKIREFREILDNAMNEVGLSREFADRYLNDGFSGGEKKKMEMLQLFMLQPRLVILDEIDSGLDVDALRTVNRVVRKLHKQTNMSVLCITHYPQMLRELVPDVVRILRHGNIIATGGVELAHRIEKYGYDVVDTSSAISSS